MDEKNDEAGLGRKKPHKGHSSGRFAEGVAKGELPKDEKTQAGLIRLAFIPHLARVNQAGQFARRIAIRTEISPEARPLIDRLVEARLLITDRRTVGGKDVDVVEVAHEAILREWKDLNAALIEEREFLVAKGQLEQDVAEYKNTPDDQKKGALLAGNKLARSRDWLVSRPQDLTAEERQFIQASADAEQEERERRVRDAEALAEANRRTAFRTRVGLFAALALLVLSVGAAVIAVREQARAQSALARMLIERTWSIADRNQALATRYALAGMAAAQGSEALGARVAHALAGMAAVQGSEALGRAALARVAHDSSKPLEIKDHSAVVARAAFDPSGHQLLTVDQKGKAIVSDSVTGALLWALPADDVEAGGFSPDGSVLLTIRSNGDMLIWRGHKLFKDFRGHSDFITTAKLSPDSRRLLSASADATARLWDISSGKLIATLRHDDVVNDAIFSSDGSRLLTLSRDHTARLWDADTGAEISVLKLNGKITSAAFSPDGEMIAVAIEQSDRRASAIVLWGARAASEKALAKVGARIETLSFGQAGSDLLANDSNGNFYEWKVPSGSLDRAFNAQVSGVERGIFRVDGAIFIGDGEHGPAIVWEAKTGRIIDELPHDQLAGYPLTISPEGDVAVIGLKDGRVLLWNFSRALRPVGILMKEACIWLDQNGGRSFSEFEVANDPLIEEAWERGNSSRQVCTDDGK